MRPIRHILVAVKNPDASSFPAVGKAAQLAQALGATLELFHGIATPLYFDAYGSLNEISGRLRRQTPGKRVTQLERIAAPLRRRGLVVTTAATWDYPAHEAILRRARRTRADLIVAECHPTPHVLPGILRIPDWELLRLSPVPVLLVKSRTPYKAPTLLAAIDPQHTFAKPLSLDREILRLGGAFSRALKGSLHTVHAYVAVPSLALGMPIDPATLDLVSNASREKAESALRSELRGIRINGARRHILPMHPIDAIEKTARELDSAIVVMGAVSRSGLRRFVIGNTAEALLDRLSCDLLIVKPAEFRKRVQARSRGPHWIPLNPAPHL